MQLQRQHFRCAGCGLKVNPSKLSLLKYVTQKKSRLFLKISVVNAKKLAVIFGVVYIYSRKL